MFLIKKEAIKCEPEAFNNAINLIITSPSIVRKGICGCEIVKWGHLSDFDEEKLLETSKDSALNDSSWIWEDFKAGEGDFKVSSVTDEIEIGKVIVVVRKIFPKKVQKNNVFWTISFLGENFHE